MDQDYTLDRLSSTFRSNSAIFENQQQELVKRFKENNPNSDVPDDIRTYFNLPKALSIMCEEIEKLKNR